MISPLLASLLFAGLAASQKPAWAQCGGLGYNGGTTCISGYSCIYINDWYSQCQPGAPATTLATSTRPAPSSTASSIGSSSSSSSSSIPVPTGTGSVRYLGRVNPATKELTWPGTGIAFTFTGTSFTINLSSVTGTNSAELTIDGKSTVIASLTSTSIKNPSPLPRGTHTVTLRKRSEALYGSIFIGSVTTDGTLTPDVAPKRKIEIIGDSISVGYGLDGTNPCSNSAAVENNPKTYGALAATALNADYSVVAWSGKGIVRNYASDGQPLMPQLYTRYGANDADNSYTYPSSWVPDAIVIGLGTNDFGYLNVREKLDVAAYTEAMATFVRSLQARYPKVHVFLLSSPMLGDSYPSVEDAQHTTQVNALKSVVSQVGAAKTHFVDWPTQGADVGCDYHPNAATNAAEAKVLEAAIRSTLGW